MLIVRELLCGSHHFNEVRRGVPRMSPALLSKRLRSLAKAGIVLRHDEGNRVRYELTPGGKALGPVIMALGEWGVQWRSELGEEDFDPTLLMWDVHRSLDFDAMPDGRVVLGFSFPDVEAVHRDWWIVAEDGGVVDLCDFDPGYPVDVRVVGDLPTVVHVWRGDISWAGAMGSGGLTLEGPADVRRALPHWLKLSPFASVPREATAAGR